MSDTKIAPRGIDPVSLRNSDSGSWLRTWGNGAELLIRDEADSGRLVGNSTRLYANIYRSENRKDWTIRLFLTGRKISESDSVVSDDVWSLRMVRQMLAYVAADWTPESDDMYFLRRQARDILHQAWMEASEVELAKMGKE